MARSDSEGSSRSEDRRLSPPVTFAALVIAIAGIWMVAHQAQAAALTARESWPDAEEYVIVPPPKVAPLLYAGYNELWADITWSRTLVYYGSARIGESDLRYLERLIDNVLALDPKFKRVYSWAGAAVTFKGGRATEDEFRTSIHYLRRGITAFPDDYDLYQTLALRLWWDLEPEDPEERRANRMEAAAVAEKAIRLPTAPPDAATLVATMWSELGKIEHAERTLTQMLLTTDNAKAKAKMQQRFRDLFDADRADTLTRAKDEFDRMYQETLPLAPSDLFVILGPRPPRAASVEDLASPRSNLGAIELLRTDASDETSRSVPSP